MSPDQDPAAAATPAGSADLQLRAQLEALGSPLRLLEEIFLNAPVGLQLFDLTGHCVLVNPAHTQLFGAVPPSDYCIFQDSILESTGVLPLVRRAFGGERVRVPPLWYDARELRHPRIETGRRFAVSAEFIPLRAGGAQPTHVLLVFDDVTEAVQAREHAEESARRAAFLSEAGRLLSSTLDFGQTLSRLARLSTPMLADFCIVDLVDAEGQVRRVAAAHADPLGQPIMDALMAFPPLPGRAHPARRVIDSGQPEVLAEVPPVMLGDPRYSPEHRDLLQRLGVRSHLAVPMRSGQHIVGVITLGYVLSRRYTGADLALAEALAARAAVAIDNARLYEEVARSESALRDADQRKDEFLAMLAHELRNPLAAISNTAWMLRQRLSDPGLERNLDVLNRQTRHLGALVDDLLDVSRITRGLVQLRPEAVDLGEVVERALEVLQSMLAERRQTVSFRTPARPLVATGDPARLEQVVLNLVGNAAKYSDEGARIEIELDADGNWARLRVRDEGIGISPEFLGRLFDMFAQAERGLVRSRGGLGVGLTIVRQLVQLHGGTVTASSDGLGRGASFEVLLPLAGG